ncbi:glycoside hydrolase family 127 protein [Echinicola sediminis]
MIRKECLAKTILSFATCGILIGCQSIAQERGSLERSIDFQQPIYQELALGEIQPKGWLRSQLQIMRDGATGHLDETHDKIHHSNSGWLGGKGDAWEETPYWLDGAVPLAYQVDDEGLKVKVQKYVDWVMENQRASGYFGGITEYERENGKEVTLENLKEAGADWWPKMVMLKVLKQYYSATGDQRVIDFMNKYFAFQLKALKRVPIGNWTEWAESRGAENVMMAQWLYQQTGNEKLLELAELIESQSYAWSDWLGNRDWVIWAAAYQGNDRWMHRHAVNVGMGLKSPAINYQRTGNEKYLKALKTGWNDLMTLHGLPMGIFSGDEDLHGNAPTQGVELCAIAESMYSLEQAIGITGDTEYMDALERMTFNALPAQTNDDYTMKQYFQIANQVHIKRGVFHFSLPFGREMNNVLGAKSGYSCCLANMHQSWTKFTQHLWYKTPENGLAAVAYSPNELKTTVGKDHVPITVVANTQYPFEHQVELKISLEKPCQFPLELRIPEWAEGATVLVNGIPEKAEAGKMWRSERTWKDGDILKLDFPMQLKVSDWGRNSRAVERGPLVYALKLDEKWEKGQEQVEGAYWSVYPTNEWNYGLLQEIVNAPEDHLEVKKTKAISDEFVWNLDHAPIEIIARGKQIPDWKIINDVAPQPVTDRGGLYMGKVEQEVEELTLVPFGFTKIRVVAFPVVK